MPRAYNKPEFGPCAPLAAALLTDWGIVAAQTQAVTNRQAPAYEKRGGEQAMNPNRVLVRFLWTAVIFLAFIGLAVATRRTIVLLRPGATSSAKNPAVQLDAHFANHATLTLAHILPAMLFMVLGPLQFVRRLRSKYPWIHRWSGRIFLAASAVVGVTGLTMAFGKTIGGVDEKAAITLFGTFFLIALAKALWHAPEPKEFFGTAFWVGFTLQMIAAEIWINYTRSATVAPMVSVVS